MLAEILAPPEVLAAIADGRRQGRWIRAVCPYCHGNQKRTLSASHTGFGRHKDRPGWLCHRCHAEQRIADERRQLGKISYDPRLQRDDKRRIEVARKILEECRPVEAGDPVDLYLRRRQLRPLGSFWPSCLRRGLLRHPETKKRYPTMVAAVVDSSGMPIGIHRTYLTDDGRKADVAPAKLSFGPIAGGAVRLGIDSSRIIVAEGIESALGAAMVLGGVAWSTLSSGNMPNLVLPRHVEDVVIAYDNDNNKAGRKAAVALLDRLKQQQVSQNRRIRVVLKPPPPGQADYADFPSADS